jgi:hypothetical protein
MESVGPSKRRTDVEVAAALPVQGGGALGQGGQLIGGEQLGVGQSARARIGPGELDHALTAIVEHGPEVGEHRVEVGLKI